MWSLNRDVWTFNCNGRRRYSRVFYLHSPLPSVRNNRPKFWFTRSNREVFKDFQACLDLFFYWWPSWLLSRIPSLRNACRYSLTIFLLRPCGTLVDSLRARFQPILRITPVDLDGIFGILILESKYYFCRPPLTTHTFFRYTFFSFELPPLKRAGFEPYLA